jgi:hypothetical protein
MQKESLPLFYWVFQKPTNYNQPDIESLDAVYDEAFLKGENDGKKKNLENFVNSIMENHSTRFSEKQIIYLAKTTVLDARGLRDDTEMAQNAVSLVLRDYFCRNTKIYCEKAGELLRTESNTSQFEVMNYKPDSFGYKSINPFLQKKIFDEIKVSSNISIEDIRNIFRKTLFIDRLYVEIDDFPFDLKSTISKMIKDIEDIINDILASFTKSFTGGKGINFDKLKNIWTNYEFNTEWQGLLFKVQSYHWLIAHYGGIVAPQQISTIGFALLNNIRKDNKRLEETKIPFSLTAKLFEKTSEE